MNEKLKNRFKIVRFSLSKIIGNERVVYQFLNNVPILYGKSLECASIRLDDDVVLLEADGKYICEVNISCFSEEVVIRIIEGIEEELSKLIVG